jgi:hypothetical protein
MSKDEYLSLGRMVAVKLGRASIMLEPLLEML